MVVVAHHQWLGANGAIDIRNGIQMPDACRLTAQGFDWRLQRNAWPDVALLVIDLREAVFGDKGRDGFVGAPLWFSHNKQHGE